MKKRNVIIIDYGIGNVKSISNALVNLNAKPILSQDVKMIANADALILPGVGAFKKGMENLTNSNIKQGIYEFVKKGNPFLGICLGMQMLLEESEEFGITQGLGLVKGKVKKIPISKKSNDILPHVGWNEIATPSNKEWENSILNGVQPKSDVYFVHSYVAVPESLNSVLSTTTYSEIQFCSSLQQDNIYGTQFHPEKSGKIGLSILSNFLKL